MMAETLRKFQVSVCPSCGGTTIRAISGDWSGSFKGKSYVVKGLRYFHCPRCGETVYDPEAMRRIEATSPAFSKTQRLRKFA
jgi:YgiT-type zinc finger domain-containing protein